MKMDFNALEQIADDAIRDGRFKDAIRVYLFMSDGDPSLDGGYLAEQIAHCYEALGDIPAARYWFGRAIEENSKVDKLHCPLFICLVWSDGISYWHY